MVPPMGRVGVATRWGAGVVIAGLLVALVGPPAQGSSPVSPASAAFGWGKNSGALGDGTTTGSNVPMAVSTTSPLPSTYVDISGGGDHSCGIASTGVAYCWGSGASGRLGTGSTSNTTVPTLVVTAGALPDTYKDIEAGEVFTCGIGNDDSVYCWGLNTQGQLGIGTSAGSSSSPVAVLAGQSPGQFTDLAVGSTHACAIATNQRVYCWGYNLQGQAGVGSIVQRITSPQVALAGASPGAFTSLAAGDQRTCAIGTDSRAYCWGQGTQGGNGNGASTDDSVMVQVSAGASSGLFSGVAPGGNQTCGVSTSGAAYCWGRNASGQLGTGNTTTSSVPVAVSTADALPDTYASVSAGRDFSCGIANGGAAYCWGANGFNGSLGNGTTGGASNVPVAVNSTGVLAGRGLLQIDLGPEFVMAIAAPVSPAAAFDTPVPTPDGYTVNVINYDDSWAWTPTVTSGAVSAGAAAGGVLPLTVTGLTAGGSATVTVATTRAGYLSGSGQVAGVALGAALTPTFGAVTSTADGFTVDVINYDDSWAWTPTVTSGAVSPGAAAGGVLPLTVTGLAAGGSATVTVATTRATYVIGSATVGGSATTPPPPRPIVFRPPGPPLDVRAVPGDTSAEVAWSPPLSPGTFAVTAYRVTSSPGDLRCVTSGLSCVVAGLTNGTTYTFTVNAESAVGWGSASAPSVGVTPVEPTPPPAPTISIVGSRADVRGRPGISIAGTSKELGMGAQLVPFLRFAGDSTFVRGSARIAVDASGEFMWSRTTRRAVTVYVQTLDGSVASNEVRIAAREQPGLR